jgi:N-acetylneuraminic acid mutarotase
MPIGTTEAESVSLGGKLYLFGGFDVWKACCTPTTRAWVYDPVADTWTALPPMPTHGIDHAGIDTDGVRYIYYAGGYPADAAGTGQTFGTTAAWRYDVVTGTYSALPSLPQARSAGALAYVSGKLYYVSGSNEARTVDAPDVWMLDVANGAMSWVSRAPMPDPRNHLGWNVIGGKIYVVGGQHFSDSTKAQAELDRYDPATNAWTTLAPLPVARSHLMDSTFVLNGRLVVAGGWTASAKTDAVTAYDPATNTWQAMTSLPEPRTSTTVRSIGNRYVFVDGSAGSSNATGWIAAPVS